VEKYSCCVEPYVDITYTIVLRRKPMFFTYNLVFPCVLLMGIGILVFCLPPESGVTHTTGTHSGTTHNIIRDDQHYQHTKGDPQPHSHQVRSTLPHTQGRLTTLLTHTRDDPHYLTLRDDPQHRPGVLSTARVWWEGIVECDRLAGDDCLPTADRRDDSSHLGGHPSDWYV